MKITRSSFKEKPPPRTARIGYSKQQVTEQVRDNPKTRIAVRNNTTSGQRARGTQGTPPLTNEPQRRYSQQKCNSQDHHQGAHPEEATCGERILEGQIDLLVKNNQEGKEKNKGAEARKTHHRDKATHQMEDQEYQQNRGPQSTAHGMLKFPIDGGIVIIYNAAALPKECNTVTCDVTQTQRQHATKVTNLKVAISSHINPEQEVFDRFAVLIRTDIQLPEIDWASGVLMQIPPSSAFLTQTRVSNKSKCQRMTRKDSLSHKLEVSIAIQDAFWPKELRVPPTMRLVDYAFEGKYGRNPGSLSITFDDLV
ncbi:hypothetical protein Tco_0615803 [Tanacetum coccineum]